MLRGLTSVLIHKNNSAVIYQESMELYSFIHPSTNPQICQLFLYVTLLENCCSLLEWIYLIVYILFIGLNTAKKDSASETNCMTANRGKAVPAKDGK